MLDARKVQAELAREALDDPQELAVLRPGRNLERDRAAGRRHLDAAAESGGRERDGHLDEQIVAPALVDARRLDARDDVEVAGGRAPVPRLSLALQLDPRPVLHARRDLHGEPLRPPLAPRAVTRLAGRPDDRPHPA